MVHPAFIYVLLLLAGFTMQLACARDLAVQSAPLPVIEGKINGMDVVAQGDSVAFLAGQLPGHFSDESCSEDLHCTLHKNSTHAVQISPEGVRLLQLSPHFVERFIPAEEIGPAPTLVTLYTGNPVVDQTSGLAWINRETMRLLATTVETMNSLSTSTSGTDNDLTLIDPEPTETVKVMMTISGELDELRSRLMSSATVPVPTLVPTNLNDHGLESDEVWLEAGPDILKIRPSPSVRYESSCGTTSSFTFSVKQVPTVTGAATSKSDETIATTSAPASTESPQASNLPASKKQGVEAVATTAQAYDDVEQEKTLSCFYGFKVSFAKADYVLKEKIGQGAFGEVYRATCKKYNTDMAVKIIKKIREYPFKHEVEMRNLLYLKENPHPNIISFLGSIDTAATKLFFFEIGDMSLEDYLVKNECKLSVPHFNSILFQLFSMLDFLESIQLCHKDFHTDNMVVFLTSGIIKLIDFGESKRPGDELFKSPLSDLEHGSYTLCMVQLMMRYKSRNSDCKNAMKRFRDYRRRVPLKKLGCEGDPEIFLNEPNLWLIELPSETRVLLVRALSPDRDDQLMALKAAMSIEPKKTLTML